MRWTTLLRLAAIALAALALVMFTMQNLSRTTSLSFDAYFAAWELARPVPVPLLIWVSFGSGLGLATVVGWVRARGMARTVARLQQDALLRSAGRPSPAPADAKPAPTDDWGR